MFLDALVGWLVSFPGGLETVGYFSPLSLSLSSE